MKAIHLLLLAVVSSPLVLQARAQAPVRQLPSQGPGQRRQIQPFRELPALAQPQPGDPFEIECVDVVRVRAAHRTFAFTCRTANGRELVIRAQRVWDFGDDHRPVGTGHIYEDLLWMITTSQAVSMFVSFRQANPTVAARLQVTGFYSRFPIEGSSREAVANSLEFSMQ